MGKLIIAEYEPPDGLSPAELGYLYDSRFNMTEIYATIISLEQRGLIEIVKGGVWGQEVMRTTKQPHDQLKKHEAYLLKQIPEDKPYHVYSLRYNLGFKRKVWESLTDQGYVKEQKNLIYFMANRTAVAYVSITAVLALLVASGSDTGKISGFLLFFAVFAIAFAPLILPLAIIASSMYDRVAGRHGFWTAKLKKIWPQIEGYRNYVEQVELDNLQFESAALKERSKNKVLPYAIALNLNTGWRKR